MENSITINDIAQFKNIIDVCSRRGAFQASEMEVVGALYNRISLFIEEVDAKTRENQEESKPLESVPEENEENEKNVEMTVDSASN